MAEDAVTCTECGKPLSKRHIVRVFQGRTLCVGCDRIVRRWESPAPRDDVRAAKELGLDVPRRPTRRQMKQIWDDYRAKTRAENDRRAAEMGCPFKEVTNPMDEAAVIAALRDLASRKRTALIDYVWPSNVRAKVYLVEPYALMAGSRNPETLLLVCWGCRARTGWQVYLLRGIVGVADGGSDFAARRPVTLDTGEIEPNAGIGSITITITPDGVKAGVVCGKDMQTEVVRSEQEWSTSDG